MRLDKHEDLLLRIGSDWRIERRKIMLDQTKNLTFSFSREDAYDRADIKLSSRARRFGRSGRGGAGAIGSNLARMPRTI